MGFSLTGYVLEPPRVGASNSPFTYTPDVKVTTPLAFSAAYPSDESAPRTDYVAFVRVDGDLPDARFCWTKNEVVARAGYDGRNQRFKTLPGAFPTDVGVVSSTLNTDRLKVAPPASTNFGSFPIRLSVGVGSGTPFTINTVADEGSFGIPSVGSVELALDTGALNWAPADLTTYAGQSVRFQRQSFFTFEESKGQLGIVDDVLLLNPIPGAGQFPLIRIGFDEWLTPVERASEGAFAATPTYGTVEWARSTGRLKFNPGQVTSNTGRPVYYDGSCFAFSAQLTPTFFGTVNSPGVFSPLPPAEADTFFVIPGVVQFERTVIVDTLSTLGKSGVVEIRRSDGVIQFSVADRAAYGSQSVRAYVADLPIERGVVLRLRRSPVDPQATDPDIKDVSAFYSSLGAVLADPIIGSPKVLLPAVPVESIAIIVDVSQGTGTFVGNLPRLDVASPPTGYGFVLDFPTQELRYGRRRTNVVIPQSARKPYGTVQLPDPMVFSQSLVLELETVAGSGIFAPLTIDEDVTVDLNGGVATLTNTVGGVVATSSSGAFSGTTFTDTSVNFTTAGVVVGDLLVVLSGASKGVYTIGAVGTTTLTTDLAGTTESNLTYEIRHGYEILADRFFKDVPPLDPNTRVERLVSLGTAANSPRLSIPTDRIAVSRFRRGSSTFLTTVQVANDGAFTAPPTGTVQVSLTTGNLNFAAGDLGQTVFWARTLALGTDFRVQAALGFIQLVDRLLQNEEVFVRYAVLDDASNKVIVEERATFAVRKEVTVHPTATNTIPFNPLGRELATTPPARAYRGGRPQVTGQQVTFNYANATMMFLPDKQKTEALPHGPIVQPSERVYVDYSIYGAIGGEDSFTVSRPPMLGVIVLIQDEATSFQITGNRTADFPANHLLRVDKADVYLLAAPTYDASTDTTTVHLAAPQTFKADFQNPALAVTSGPTRVAASLLLPAYFVTEMGAYDVVPRGAKTLKLVGDKTSTYGNGVVLHWTGSGIFDFNIVEGSTYDADLNRTIVTLASGGPRQYGPTGVTLKRSSNPILPSPIAVVSTNRSPILSLPYLVFRRVEGDVGEVLAAPADYTIDASGQVVFSDPLRDSEALSIAYTGAAVVADGRDFRASYTHVVVPNASNGLAGQVLTMDYTTYAPDSFYWRVETITTFRGELAQQYNADAQATIPSGGPRLQNAAGPKLYQQGRESLYYQEGHLANEDLVARATLKFYNDGVNFLEDALRSLDGRVIGDADGPLVFDGVIGNPMRNTLSEVTNQIDDVLKVLEGPVSVTYPPFAVSFLGSYKPMYQPSKYSRFYPTKRRLFGIAADGTGLATGDTILDLGFQGLAAVNSIARRQPWAVVTQKALAGDTVLQVDNADGALDLYRPPFEPGTYDHKVAIIAQNGTVIVSEVGGGVGVASKTTTSLTLSGGVPSDVPVGATVYQVLFDPTPPATPFPKFYRLGYDVGAKLDDGVLTHIEPYPPFDGTAAGVPAELEIANPPGGEALDVAADLFNQITEPYRFSALDGGTLDDDGNRSFPILNPSTDSEGGANVGYIYLEQVIVNAGTGTLRAATTDPYQGTGSLDGTRTIITNSVPWSAPIPKVHDLVEIRTGLNALSGYYRITAVGGSTITVASAFPSVDTGFSFVVTVSNTLATGAGGTFGLATLTDALANFLVAGVKPGHTVVVTSGANTGLRRQVVSVTSATQLVITALPVGGAANYRVDDALGTFGGSNSILADLVAALDGELQTLDTNIRPAKPYSEQEGIERFFSQFFTTIVTGTTGSTDGSFELEDLSVDFEAAGVEVGQFVYIRSGTMAGVYQIDLVKSATQLDMTENFPGVATNVSYAVVKAEGFTLNTLQAVFGVLTKVDAAITSTTTFRTLVTTAVSVLGDSGAFGRRTLKSDLDTRAAEVDDRITDITDAGTGSAATLSAVMASSGKLYDKRYVWIDARINLEKGILAKQQRAVADRKKAEKEIVKQLTKLLTTQP